MTGRAASRCARRTVVTGLAVGCAAVLNVIAAALGTGPAALATTTAGLLAAIGFALATAWYGGRASAFHEIADAVRSGAGPPDYLVELERISIKGDGEGSA